MQSRTKMVLAVAALIAPGCAPQVDLDAEAAAILATIERWQALGLAGDAAGVASLFTPEGSAWITLRKEATGREAIEAFEEESSTRVFHPDGGWGSERIEVAAAGDMAVDYGSWRDGPFEGRYISVYREVGGEWLIEADVSTRTRADDGAPDWAKGWLTQWYEHYNARDARSLADLYTPDAHVVEARGRVAIIAAFEQGWEEDNDTCEGNFWGVEVVGSAAISFGSDRCTRTANDGSTTAVVSNWLAVFEQQSDGRWLATRNNGEPSA